MTTTTNIVPTPEAMTLTALRALAAKPPDSMADALQVAERQARLLHERLAKKPEPMAERLTALIPRLWVGYVSDMPIDGIAFWNGEQWIINLRANDAIEDQQFSMLHLLKHIIDHPLRRDNPRLFDDADWAALADHFAKRAMTRQRTVEDGGTKRKEEALWTTTIHQQ